MQHENEDELIQNISQQFFCNVSLKDFNLGDLTRLSYEGQDILLKNTINSDLNTKYSVKIEYQKAFLKHLINRLEKQESAEIEVHDSLYSAYGRLVSLGGVEQRDYSYKHYILKNFGFTISLKENVHLIAEGTTGLRTWQAALALSEWALQNRDLFKDQNILELGSGIGLTGLTLALLCPTKSVYLTDCHPKVIDNLASNIKLNIEKTCHSNTSYFNDTVINKKHFHIDGNINCDRNEISVKSDYSVNCLNLPWEKVDKNICVKKIGQIDKIFAADVVYDNELFEPLIGALKCLCENCQVAEVIFACTERNKNTLDEFLQLIEQSFYVEKLAAPSQENFIWPTDTPVRLFRFKIKC